MNSVEAALRKAVGALNTLGTPWAIVGGFAVSARTEPRFTRDVDFAVAVADDSAAETAVRDLMTHGYRLFATVEHDVAARLATARLVDESTDGVIVDLLFASSGIEQEIAHGADRLELVPSLWVPVAQLGLLAIKLLARDDKTRPQDRADLQALRAVATPADLTQARVAIEAITKRGFARGRDLRHALDELIDAN